jgi:hypothetical protein
MAGIVILVIAICILAGTTVNNYLDTVDNQQEREHHETMAKLGWVYDDNEERWVPIGTRKERTDIKDEGELRTKEPRVSPEA